MSAVDLKAPLSLRTSFRFPLQSTTSRAEVLLGAALLCVPVVGWLWNMGHRIEFVHRMLRGHEAWPAARDTGRLLRNGFLTFLGMVFYLSPGTALVGLGLLRDVPTLIGIGVILQSIAIVAIPGYMSHYCVAFDVREIFDPFLALRRVLEGGAAYWRAWGIALAALVLSFVVPLVLSSPAILLAWWSWPILRSDEHNFVQLLPSFGALCCFGSLFCVASVWFWQVAGFSFATVFSRRFALHVEARHGP